MILLPIRPTIVNTKVTLMRRNPPIKPLSAVMRTNFTSRTLNLIKRENLLLMQDLQSPNQAIQGR